MEDWDICLGEGLCSLGDLLLLSEWWGIYQCCSTYVRNTNVFFLS